LQNIALNMIQSEVNNGDGTFTYSHTVPASQYQANDLVKVRFYAYEAGKPAVFTPGPSDSIWSEDFRIQ
jgi:hypothetical protein